MRAEEEAIVNTTTTEKTETITMAEIMEVIEPEITIEVGTNNNMEMIVMVNIVAKTVVLVTINAITKEVLPNITPSLKPMAENHFISDIHQQ